MKVINLFGGPCAGKSTMAARLFADLKLDGYKVELVREYAKDLVYEKRALGKEVTQLEISVEQEKRQRILEDEIDIIITDSPILLGCIYGIGNSSSEHKVIMQYFNKYDNYNFAIPRYKKYQQYGRLHDEDAAKELDKNIVDLLKENNIDFTDLTDIGTDFNTILHAIKSTLNDKGVINYSGNLPEKKVEIHV